MTTNRNLFRAVRIRPRDAAILALAIVAFPSLFPDASAQQTNPVPPAEQVPEHDSPKAAAPSNSVPASGVVRPRDVDPKMAQPVPNVDPAMNKPPADSTRPPPETPPKTPPDVQPR